jgi:GntR family transcriptional regulator/MocR family aminotransferase
LERGSVVFGIVLEASGDLTRTRQLCDRLRRLVAEGRIPAGSRLPSTRSASRELGISRHLVIEAYEQLTAEGYLETRVGSGTYAARITRPMGRQSAGGPARAYARAGGDREAYRGRTAGVVDFDRASGTPDPLAFPVKLWASCLKKAAETASAPSFSYSRGEDDRRFQEAVSSYLFRAKGIECSAERVIVTAGASEGILFSGFFFSACFSRAFVEDPTLHSIRRILERCGFHLSSLNVDERGADPDAVRRWRGKRGLIVLTPSHQFPTGAVLDACRRMEFLESARRTDGTIIEDDYDGELRFKGLPIPPMVTLDAHRVIHAGTFSKTMFPSIRMGFLVVPKDLVVPMKRFKREYSFWSNLINQRAMALFIEQGHYERHVRRMKKIYAGKRALLEEELKKAFAEGIAIGGNAAGVHLTVEFPREDWGTPDWSGSRDYGFEAVPLEYYGPDCRTAGNRIVLGYGDLAAEQVREGVSRLARFVRAARRSQGVNPG